MDRAQLISIMVRWKCAAWIVHLVGVTGSLFGHIGWYLVTGCESFVHCSGSSSSSPQVAFYFVNSDCFIVIFRHWPDCCSTEPSTWPDSKQQTN